MINSFVVTAEYDEVFFFRVGLGHGLFEWLALGGHEKSAAVFCAELGDGGEYGAGLE